MCFQSTKVRLFLKKMFKSSIYSFNQQCDNAGFTGFALKRKEEEEEEEEEDEEKEEAKIMLFL